MLPGRPDEAMNTLDGAIARTEQAIVESRNAIQFLRSQGSDLLHSLSAVAQELSSDQPSGAATFRVIVEGEPQPLSPMIQEEVFPIARELLQNAFHHAHAKEIEAELHYGRDKFRLRIRDDGTGIAPSVIADGGRAGHWGLPGTRERAQRIGAHLDFWSELGAGTEVELTLAASTAYKARDAHSSLGPFRKAGNHDQQS
jgi:signal transduction histidine kinase